MAHCSTRQVQTAELTGRQTGRPRLHGDGVDLKVKVDPEPSVGWSRCLDIIGKAAKEEEKKATEPHDDKDVD